MAKDLKEAIVKMMRSYWKGEEPESSGKLNPNRKYNKKYFDKISDDAGFHKDDLENAL